MKCFLFNIIENFSITNLKPNSKRNNIKPSIDKWAPNTFSVARNKFGGFFDFLVKCNSSSQALHNSIPTVPKI